MLIGRSGRVPARPHLLCDDQAMDSLGELPLPVSSPGNRQPRWTTLAERMTETQTPGVAVAVIDDGELEWADAWGVLQAGKAAPVRTDSIFQVCSVSKHVTMVGVLRLIQEGRLDLDEDVNRRLKSWEVPPNQGWRPAISLRQLLGHTAGLTYNWYRGYWRNEPKPTLLQVLEGQPPANTPPVRSTLLPGSRFRYSGSHYSVLQQLLIDVTGTSFPDLMRDLVLEPLGMRDSSFDQTFPETRLASSAVGHYIGAQPLRDGWRVLPEMAAAGLWSSAPDLARLALELQRAHQGKSTVFLETAVVKEAFRTGPAADFGLGTAFIGKGESLTFGHGGGNIGYKCRSMAYRDSRRGAVVLTNGEDGWMIVEEVLSGLAERRGWPLWNPRPAPVAWPLEHAASHVGSYLLRGDLELRITLDDGLLRLNAAGQPPLLLEPMDGTTYVSSPLDLKVTFTESGLELDGEAAPRVMSI